MHRGITARTLEGALEDHVDFMQRQESDHWFAAHLGGVLGNYSRDHTGAMLPKACRSCVFKARARFWSQDPREQKTAGEGGRSTSYIDGLSWHRVKLLPVAVRGQIARFAVAVAVRGQHLAVVARGALLQPAPLSLRVVLRAPCCRAPRRPTRSP